MIHWCAVELPGAGVSRNSLADAPPAERVGRLLASPTGVLIILPLLVIGAGVVVMLLGRRATSDASEGMARRQLAAQATDVQRDVAFALDQADSLLDSLRVLADPALPIEEVAIRMRDMQLGRPGIANVSIAYPNGVMRGSFLDPESGELRVQESIPDGAATKRQNYSFASGLPQPVDTTRTNYDPRTRPHYVAAEKEKARVWLPPRTFFTSKKTGLTVTEPVYGGDGALRAVTTVDFDVSELSAFISRPPFQGARTVMFAADGTILAFPSVPMPEVAVKENRLLKAEDYKDPALTALFASLDTIGGKQLRFFTVHAADGQYLASVAPVGGKRAGISAPLDWYLATLVPERVLLGPTRRLEKQSLIASAGALAIALGVALMFAWNLVRMRKAVGAAREAARSAEARAREFGSYRLVARLGVGGMGEVWRAEHRLLAREAAIKLVRPEMVRDPRVAPKVRERFRREAQTLASMKSTHTIALYDYGTTDDGTFYYVMELLDGVDLDKLVREHGAQPAARVIKLLIQACQSLAEAHEAGLLHRDIKPANLFVCRVADEVDVLKVLDFGIVHTMNDPVVDAVEAISIIPEQIVTPSGRLTIVGAVVGTPGYIPPEQAFGHKIDGRSDLYALACVAWWLLTANEVYARAREESETIRAHVQDPLPALRPKVRGWLPPELEDLIVACLAKWPDQRPRDAREMIQRLRAIEIPAEHAWTDAKAASWWGAYKPTSVQTLTPEAATSVAPRTIMPANLDGVPIESSPRTIRAKRAPAAGPPTMPADGASSLGPPTMPADGASSIGPPTMPGDGASLGPPTMPGDGASLGPPPMPGFGPPTMPDSEPAKKP
jgi:serine/threonine protein kinase